VAKGKSDKLRSEEHSYRRTRFSVETIREAVKVFDQQINPDGTIENVLEAMLAKATIAFFVMTGEDETVAGSMNPRLNVVHELGLFQGRLGFNKGIVLLKRGAAEFSTIAGLQQIRFADIKEVFGNVVATINRESRNN